MAGYNSYLERKKKVLGGSTTDNTSSVKKNTTAFDSYLARKKTTITTPFETPSKQAAQKIEVKQQEEKKKGTFIDKAKNTFEKIKESVSNLGKKKIQQQQEIGGQGLQKPEINATQVDQIKLRKNIIDYTINSNPIIKAQSTQVTTTLKQQISDQGLIDTAITNIQKKIEEKPENYKWLIKAQKFVEDTPFVGLNKNPLSKGIVQGTAQTLLGSSDKVQETFNTRLTQPVTWEGKTFETVGQVIGGILPYLVGTGAAKAIGLGKAALPIVFATLGQTSLGSNTTVGERLGTIPIDLTMGWIFSKIPGATGFNKELLKSFSKVSGTVGAGTFAKQFFVKGEDAKTSAESAGIAAATAGLFYMAASAMGLLVKPRQQIKTNTMTPDQIRETVYKNNAQGTEKGKGLLDLANTAEQQGSNIEFKGTLTYESLLKEIIKGKTNIKSNLNIETKLVEKPGAVKGGEGTVVKPEVKTNLPTVENMVLTPQGAMETVTLSNLAGTEAGNKIIEFSNKARESGNFIEIDYTGKDGTKVTTPEGNVIAIKIGAKSGIETSSKPLETTETEAVVPKTTETTKTTPKKQEIVKSIDENKILVSEVINKGIKGYAFDSDTGADIKIRELIKKELPELSNQVINDSIPQILKEVNKTLLSGKDVYSIETLNGKQLNTPIEITNNKNYFEGKKVSTPEITKEKPVVETETKPIKSTDFRVGDVLDPQGNTNMVGEVKVRAIEGNTLKFIDSEGTEYSGMVRTTVRDLINGNSWKMVSRGSEPQPVPKGKEPTKQPSNEPKPAPTEKEVPPKKGRELTLKPSKAKTEKKFLKELSKTGTATAEVLNKGKYPRKPVGKTEIKTFLKSKEFAANPVFTVVEGTEWDYAGNKKLNMLEFKSDKLNIILDPRGLGINGSKLKPGDKITVDIEAFKKGGVAGVQQVRVYKGTTVFADTGGYANVESVRKSLENLKTIEFPELLRMYKSLTNKTPVLKVFRKYLGAKSTKLGVMDSGEGIIKLSYEIFKDPKLAIKVFAHEFGHLTDFFPDKTIKRGNILGRIATLRSYRKTLLPEEPGGEGLLTEKDRQKLRSEAIKITNQPIKEEYTVIIGSEKIKPPEVVAIWNDVEAGLKSPELMDYIKTLSEAQKVEIIKAAIKGSLPKWVDFGKQIKENKIREVIRNSPEDIRKKYKELLKEEIIKRKLFNEEEVRNELKNLTQLWKPFDPSINKSFTQYRYSSVELYADAISVLFNDPYLLKKNAPLFWKGFFNYLDTKPEIRDNFFKIQEILNAGDEQIFQERYKELQENYDKAEDAWLAQEIEKKNNKVNILGILNTLFNDKNAAINKKVYQAIKDGKDIDPEFNPIYDLAGLNYMEGNVKNFVYDNFQPAVTKTNEVENGWSELGKILQLERAIYERGELANPGGYDPKTAQWTLDKLEKQIGVEDWNKLQEAKQIFREGMQKLVDEAEKEGFYTPEMLVQMKANKAYATFQVLDYIDQKVTSAVHQQKGTLKGIANPATTSLMKMVTTLRAIRYNKSKKLNLNFIKDLGELKDAKTIWNGRTRVPIESKDKNLSLVRVIENGKLKGYYVDKEVGLILNNTDEPTLRKLGTISRILTGAKIYRPLFTSINLGFQSFNFIRDFTRAWKNLPDKTIGEVFLSFPRLVKGYIQASPHAWKKAIGTEDELIREMETNEIFGITRNDLYGTPDPGEEEITRVLRKIGLVPEKEGRSLLRKYLKPVIKIFDAIEVFGNYIEALPKVAGYKMLKNKYPSNKELAYYIRNYIGSPDFMVMGKGTPITNNVFLFSNAIKEGIKGDLNMAFKSKTRGAWWFKSMLRMIPKFIQIAGSLGLLGLAYKKMLDSVSEYDKTNYDIVPLGVDENGKTKYIRIPLDETSRFQGALLWKMANLFTGSQRQELTKDLGEIFSLWSGQIPSFVPSITGAMALSDYLSGNNPYDSFRNRNIIPDNEFNAGFKYSWPKMLQWLLNNQGASIVIPAYRADGNSGFLEKMVNLPVLSNLLGRFLRVSDYGQTEIAKKIKAEEEQKIAEKAVIRNQVIDDAIKRGSAPSLPEINRILGHELDTNNEDDIKEVVSLMKKYEIQSQVGKSVFMDNLIYAGTNAAKAEMLKEYQKNMTGEEFKKLLEDAYQYKIITNDVFEKYNKKVEEDKKKGLLNFNLIKTAWAAENNTDLFSNIRNRITTTKNENEIFLNKAIAWVKELFDKDEQIKIGDEWYDIDEIDKDKAKSVFIDLKKQDLKTYNEKIGSKVEKRLWGEELKVTEENPKIEVRKKEEEIIPTPSLSQDKYIGNSTGSKEKELKDGSKVTVYTTEHDSIIDANFGTEIGDEARRVLKWINNKGQLKGENPGYKTGEGWVNEETGEHGDYNYLTKKVIENGETRYYYVLDENGKKIIRWVDSTNGKDTTIDNPNAVVNEDRGLFRINSGSFYDYWNRRKKELQQLGINSYDDMYDVDKNIAIAKMIYDDGGWKRWYGAAPELIK